MIENQSSRTALAVAVLRALHQVVDVPPVFVDVSDVVPVWTAAMDAHASQLVTRSYVELQLTRARLNGQRAGVGHAIGLYPNDPILVRSLSQLGAAARHF